jgi:hypothetical protein
MSDSTSTSSTSIKNDNLEDLLKVLHKQINSTGGNWIKQEATKLEQENPELIEGWNNEITKLKEEEQQHK